LQRDFSLFQWLGDTPQRQVVDTLFKDDEEAGKKFLEALQREQEDVTLPPQSEESTGEVNDEL